MPTTTIKPDGNGTQNLLAGSYTDIDEGMASTDDGTTVVTMGSGTGYGFFLLENVPEDYGTTDSLTISVRCTKTGKNATVKGRAQIFESDESTAITDEVEFDIATVGTYESFTETLTITGTDSKANWNGARLKLSADSGTGVFACSTADVNLTYTAGGGGGGGGLLKSAGMDGGFNRHWNGGFSG